MTTRTIRFDASRADAELIQKIVERYSGIFPLATRLDVSMDVTTCHLNGTPLDLAGLEQANKFNFIHDVSGIVLHLDRNTGRLRDYFMPRFAARQVAA